MSLESISGRTAHKHKVTFYLSEEEIHALDATVVEVRRRTGGKRIDRGRYIREAVFTASLSKIAARLRDAPC